MKIQRNALTLAALSLIWGCSSNDSAVDIGDAKTGQKLSDYAATWEGYAEAFDFEDGSDQVRIVIDAEGNGTLEIGDSPALPVATDPDVAYPVDSRTREGFLEALFPGFSYPIRSAEVAEARLQLVVNPYEIESDWCALQTSYLVDGGELYQCLPPSAAGFSQRAGCSTDYGDGDVAVDCGKANACSVVINACSCDENGCGAYQGVPGQNGNFTLLDAALETSGNSLVGTLRTGRSQSKSVTVRLNRVD